MDDTQDIKKAASEFIQKVYGSTRPAAKKLTPNEKIALFGMVRYPDYKDKDICNAVGLKISTLTAIKNRLKARDVFRTIRVPNFPALGFKVINVINAKMDPKIPLDIRNTIHRDISVLSDGIYFYMESGQNISILYFTENYSEAQDIHDAIHDICETRDVYIETQFNSYPAEQTYMLNNFDFSNILARLFEEDLINAGLEHEARNAMKLHTVPWKHKYDSQEVSLTRYEKRVFLGLIKYADYPDKGVAEKTGVTRQTVARMKAKFMKENLFFNRKVPNLKKLDVNIVGTMTAELNPTYPVERRVDGLNYVYSMIPIFFWITSNIRSNFFFAVRDYREFQELKIRTEAIYKEKGYMLREPDIWLLPVDTLNIIKAFDPLPLLERKFDMTVDF